MLLPIALMVSWIGVTPLLDVDSSPAPTTAAKVDAPKGAPDLRVRITDDGFEVLGASATPTADHEPAVSIPCARTACAGDSYDLAALGELLWEVKQRYPDHKKLTLLPDADIPYAVILRTMKAAQQRDVTPREEVDGTLFPFVVIKSAYR